MSRKIIITGASGFIGSHLVNKFPEDKIIAIISPLSIKERKIANANNLTKVSVDLTNPKSVDKLFSKVKPQVVIHLATHGVYQYQQKDKERIIMGNYLMTLNLLKSSLKYRVKKFINTGSVFEYGTKKGAVRENDVDLRDIINEYSAVKMATTALVNSYTDSLKVITLRPFTTFGPDEDETRFIRSTITRALKNEPIRIVHGVVRDFVYVEDVADAYTKAVNKTYTPGEILNVGSGKKSTLNMVALIIKKLTKSKSKIIVDQKYLRGKESRCWANIDKTAKYLSWTPKHTLYQGLRETVDWVKTN